jgi:hypothetical protein
MKANELRIGNWVNNNEEDYQITSATISQLERGDSTAMPIPLTEEWLLRLGFEKPAHSWNGKIFHLSQWDAYPLNWCVAMDKNGAVIVHKLKYVHQLQNLYFALTNEELTIM